MDVIFTQFAVYAMVGFVVLSTLGALAFSLWCAYEGVSRLMALPRRF